MCVCVCARVCIKVCLLLYMAVKFSLAHLQKYIGSWRSTSRYRGNICVLDGGGQMGKGRNGKKESYMIRTAHQILLGQSHQK
jgi:hypothetical protein